MTEGNGPDGYWVKGTLETLPTAFDCAVRVDGKTYSLKDLEPAKRKLKVGQTVIMTFPAKNRYYAKDIEVSEVEPVKQKDYVELIREIEPLAGEIVSTLTDAERETFLGIFQHSLGIAASVYNTHASYEDTKKDAEDGALKVVEIGFAIAITVDSNTTQILKKHLPPKE